MQLGFHPPAKSEIFQRETVPKMSAASDDDMEFGGYASDSGGDTDEELKEAFAAGLLKPGLNLVGEAPVKKQFKNNVALLKQKLGEVKKDLPWVSSGLAGLSDCLMI